MSDFIEICSKCGEPFGVNEHGKGWSVQDREPVICPYCTEISSERKTGGWFTTVELSDEQKAEHRERIEQLRKLKEKRDTTT